MKHIIRRLFSCLCAVALLFALLSAAAGAEESPAAHVYFCAAPYGSGATEVSALVMTEDPAHASLTEADIAGEILYFPFDTETGLYAVNSGEPAGNRAEILKLSEDRTAYTVRLKEPGKYTLSGAPYYAFDPAVPALASLRAELDEAVDKYYGETEKATAGKLHDWLCGRVRSVIPEDRADLVSACADPMNALLSGYASREAYAQLYWILLRAANIRSLVVSGQMKEDAATWNLCSLDNAWYWTDCAADDAMDKKQKKYLSQEDKAFMKDHTLSAADRIFTDSMTRTSVFDRMTAGTLPFTLDRPAFNSDRIVEEVWYEGPSIVIGNSATITFHMATNFPMQEGQDSARHAAIDFSYSAWLDEDLYYASADTGMAPEPEKAPKISDPSEILTVEEAAQDLSSFTVTFHRPGLYSFYNSTNFYLISPEQTALVDLAGQINKAIEAAKSPTEKETARKLVTWLCRKVNYDYSFGDSARGIVADYEPMTALLYGKCVCGGYAAAYSMLLQQAGILSFPISGNSASGGHTWNLCRFDGIWSHTDPTWIDGGRQCFALTQEQNNKQHGPYQVWMLEKLFFGDPFTLWADQFDAAYQAADYIPRTLKTLPSSVAGYGFPKNTPDFIRFRGTHEEAVTKRTVYEMSRNAYESSVVSVNAAGEESQSYRYGAGTNKSSISAPPSGNLIKARAASYNYYGEIKRPSVYTEAYFRGGQQLSVTYEYRVPMKKNEIRGYSEKSWRGYGYDENLKPAWMSWHLENLTGYTVITVYFTPEGTVDHASVSLEPTDQAVTVWETSPDGTLLSYKQGKLSEEDLTKVDSSAWEAVRFE